jgi:hypothetical protein
MAGFLRKYKRFLYFTRNGFYGFEPTLAFWANVIPQPFPFFGVMRNFFSCQSKRHAYGALCAFACDVYGGRFGGEGDYFTDDLEIQSIPPDIR